MSHSIEKPTDIDVPADSMWAKLPMIGGVLAVVGLGATLGSAMGEATRARAMFSYLWAFEVFLSIALGALGWTLIDHTVRAAWSVTVKRVSETKMATLPVFALLWIPIGTIGYHVLYPWTHEHDTILERKRWFLSDGFFFGRAILYWLVWIALSQLLYRWSTRRDGLTSEVEKADTTKKMWGLSAPGILLWALTISFAAIDWLMSLQPHWYSTIFGVYYFAGATLASYSLTTLFTMGLQNAGAIKKAVTPEHYHDLGKLMFGFTVFWAYIAFSQFILIWYANIPEETEFYIVRVQGGWQYISYALPVLHFGVPFFYLLSRHIKRSRMALAAGAIWMLVMHAVDLYWLVLPNFGTHGEGAHEGHLAVSWLDFAALIGMGGAFLAAYGFFLKKNKVLAINDPRLPESLVHENY
jgi:hypothetical protein